MELRLRKRIKNKLPRFDNGKWPLFTRDRAIRRWGEENNTIWDAAASDIYNSTYKDIINNSAASKLFWYDVFGIDPPKIYSGKPTEIFTEDKYGNTFKSYRSDEYTRYGEFPEWLDLEDKYGPKTPEPAQLPQTTPKPIQQPVQVLPKPAVVYSESFRRPDLNTPDYYRAGSLAPQNLAYHPTTINTPDFLGPAPAKPQLIVKANSNYRRPTQIDPDKVANQASVDKAAESVPMREFTLPDTEVVSNMPNWKALGYTSKEAYDNVVKFGSTVLGKEQHKALTGQKIASVVGGVASLAQNYIGQQSAVKSTEELMANAGTLNRSIGGVGYIRQNYANDSLIMSGLNKSGLSSTLSGVASGAAAGAPFGWIGAGVGAVVGGLTGALGWGTSRNAQRKRLNNARQLTGRINTGNQAGAMTTALQQDYYSQNGNTGGVLYT